MSGPQVIRMQSDRPAIDVTRKSHSHDTQFASQRDVRNSLAQLDITATFTDDDDEEEDEQDDEDDDEGDGDPTLQDLKERDAEAILSPVISCSGTHTQRHPNVSISSIDEHTQSSPNPSRTPTPPKRGLFVNSNGGSFGSLSSSIFTRPRSTSLSNPSNPTPPKTTSSNSEKKSVFSTFNLPSLQFPYKTNSATSSEQTKYEDGVSEQKKHAGSSSRPFSQIEGNNSNTRVGSNLVLSQSSDHIQLAKENANLNSSYKRHCSPKREKHQTKVDDHKRISSVDTTHNDQAVPPLRRIKSDPRSLNRISSNASSILSTDSQFADVKTQVNSRFKAVRDSVLPDLKDSATFRTLNSSIPKYIPLIGTSPSVSAKEPEKHPLELLHGQTIVILGGYRGTVLHKIKPAVPGSELMRRGRRVWIPIKAGFNLRKIDLEVPLDSQAEIKMHETSIVPSKVLSHIGPVDICRRLIRKLRSNPNVRLIEFPYDWRLSPRLTSAKLVKFLADIAADDDFLLPDGSRSSAKPLVIAHSMGGLITRHAINQRPDLFGGVIYAGVPQRCVNILGPLKNGDSVLLNDNILTAQVNFTIRSSFIFLPEDGKCFKDKRTGKNIPINFYDAQTWQDLHLSPCVVEQTNISTHGIIHAASSAMAVLIRESREVKDKLTRLTPPASPKLRPKGIISHARHTYQELKTDSKDVEDNGSSSVSRSSSIPNLGNGVQEMAASGAGAVGPNMNTSSSSAETGVNQSCTLPLSATMPYLSAILEDTKRFRSELAYRPELLDEYPPAVVIYAKSTPTVRGALVDGKDAIKRDNCYDDLVFGAGDGVCLVKEAQLPPGYVCTKQVLVDRGHVSLLGDLDAVAISLEALISARSKVDSAKAAFASILDSHSYDGSFC